MPDPFVTLGDLPLQGTSEDGKKAPDSRLKNVKDARDIHEGLVQGDKKSSINRMLVQAVVDGEPPFDRDVLRNSGMSDRTNLNFGHAEMLLEQAMAAYVDLAASVEHLVECETTVGEPSQQEEWSRIISEEISDTMVKWTGFDYEHLNLCTHFVLHGVGVAYWEDDRNWQWKSSGLGDVRIPRQTPASEDKIEVVEAERCIPISQLYRTIRNEAEAAKRGWNIQSCRQAMVKAANSAGYDNWERLQTELKNNDVGLGARATQLELVHMWVPEFGGKVSHFIFTKEGNEDDFLYKGVADYDSVHNAFVFFPYGLGTNGTYHGIRGQGFKIYAHAQLANRMWSHAVDAAALGSAAMVQPTDLRTVENFSLISQGPFAFLPPNMNFVNRPVPDLSKSVMPVLDGIDRLMNERVGQYSTASVFAGDREKTRFEVAAHLDEASKLSATNLNFFYGPADRLIQEVVRRMTRKGYSPNEPGGDLIKELYDRCAVRGVPAEALHAVDYSTASMVRAVGNGSQAKRIVSLQQLREVASSYDDEGQYNLDRDITAALIGYKQANRYKPKREDTRVPQEMKVAMLENSHLIEGEEVPVFPNERHIVHLDAHVPRLEQLREAYEAGEAPLEDIAVASMPLFDHALQHLQAVQGDAMVEGAVSNYNQRLQNINEIIVNGQRLLQSQAREQQGGEGEAPAEGEEGQQVSPAEQALMERAMKHRLELEHMQKKFELKMSQQQAEFEQKRQMKDMEGAIKLRELL